MEKERIFVIIRGIVQGVGFRPFIHRLVREYSLTGYIRNTSSGVEMELEGRPDQLDAFLTALPERKPALAVIDAVEVKRPLSPAGFTGFEIRESRREDRRNTLISPDICICDDCLRELLTPGDRRYRYPFINCTNCGPRFTIIRDVPYDRGKTSMAAFPMCPECEAEYHDIENRRYHAQPDACPVCGPQVFFSPGEVTGEAAIQKAQRFLKEGKIIAVKGLGGMHLACRADDGAIVDALRVRKHRDSKPFAVMCRDLESVKRLCEVSREEAAVLESAGRPIVLLKKRPDAPCALSHLSENEYLGVMLPYTPLHVLLFEGAFDALVMTSANISDTPIVRTNAEAFDSLAGIADGYLLHNREIQTRCDDSLCVVLEGREYFLRRSRGYVPLPVRSSALPAAGSILGCGAEQKASFCLTKGNLAFLSQHIGDLKNYETLSHYEQQIHHFERLFDLTPRLVACDMHPDYLSTETAHTIAQSLGVPVVPVQHHHAHMASCMADNNLTGDCLGLVWDGTGYGTDGSIWGGECLAGGYEGFRRLASLLPIPLIGGDRAVLEADRVAFALRRLAGWEIAETAEYTVYDAMLKGGINCPPSSGMGRLFDGVSALLDVCHTAGYEGQGAVLLEAVADKREEGAFEIAFTDDGGLLRFDWRPMIRQLLEAKQAGADRAALAGRFLNTLVEMAVRQCLFARDATGLDRVVLSGGTFQNMVLCRKLPSALRKAGFEVYLHRNVACNDEGLCLGQAAVAGAGVQAGK